MSTGDRPEYPDPETGINEILGPDRAAFNRWLKRTARNPEIPISIDIFEAALECTLRENILPFLQIIRRWKAYRAHRNCSENPQRPGRPGPETRRLFVDFVKKWLRRKRRRPSRKSGRSRNNPTVTRPGTFRRGFDARRGRGPRPGAPNAGRPRLGPGAVA
jgi:hypothetical protein